jgi:hypothetical protein
MDERLEAERVLMVKTLSELASLLTQAEIRMDVLMCLEVMPQMAALNLRKHIDTACSIVGALRK